MVTLRTYWSPAQAALAKSLLDNYEIPCALLDENAGLYNRGAQFAVPIRLVVDEEKAALAICILNADFEKAAEIEATEGATEIGPDETPPSEVPDRNPWELLMLAFYLAVPAICLICTKFPTDVTGRWERYYIARVTVTRFLSWLAVVLAGVLIAFYFRLRRSSANSLTK
jgi:Putative prokaryotic signal transducing protein